MLRLGNCCFGDHPCNSIFNNQAKINLLGRYLLQSYMMIWWELSLDSTSRSLKFERVCIYFEEIRSVFCLYLHSGWNFLTKFCSSYPSFNENILISLYLKSDTSTHAQLCDYSFIHTIYKFHSVMLAGNSHWGYLLINGVYS